MIISVKNGWAKTIIKTNAIQHKQQANLAHNEGPQSSEPRTNGFHENLNRPTGGGKYGFVLGSDLAAPEGIVTAFSFGQIWIL